MEKTLINIFLWLLVVLSSTTSPAAVQGKYHSHTHIVDLPTTIKKTHLHFYLHETTTGRNPRSILVAEPNNTFAGDNNFGPFGSVYVFDDRLIEGPDKNSKVIGNARGLYASVSSGSDKTLFFNGDFEFTSGEFNGSSIVVASRNPLVSTKELAVVGGRGKFRMAKGFILANQTSPHLILEMNVTVFHP